jgi:hypothetical protein
MITTLSSKASSEVALISLDVTLKTPRGVYSISSEGPLVDSGSPVGNGIFGAISWPVSRFRVAEELLLEQQMFLPHDGSTVALSWALRGNTAIAAQLVVRPFFAGCGPRSYRDTGFQFDSEDNGGRLTWLPNVRGPRVFADTNGEYHDEPVRLFDCFCEQAAGSASDEVLITPGHFEFQLGSRPSVLILSMEACAPSQRAQHIGVFLAGLMQQNSAAQGGFFVAENVGMRNKQLIAA